VDPLGWTKALKIAFEIADALDTSHRAGIVPRLPNDFARTDDGGQC
jgi:hypothetical protein